MIKKADILLFLCLLVFGITVSWFSLSGSIAGEKVRVTADGELYGVYALDQDQRIEIVQNGHTNYITIKDGTAAMTSSSCKNQVCVETGAISRTKDKIVCLPNKVLVEIIAGNGQGGDVDVISG